MIITFFNGLSRREFAAALKINLRAGGNKKAGWVLLIAPHPAALLEIDTAVGLDQHPFI